MGEMVDSDGDEAEPAEGREPLYHVCTCKKAAIALQQNDICKLYVA
jgi:hypothetical protein